MAVPTVALFMHPANQADRCPFSRPDLLWLRAGENGTVARLHVRLA